MLLSVSTLRSVLDSVKASDEVLDFSAAISATTTRGKGENLWTAAKLYRLLTYTHSACFLYHCFESNAESVLAVHARASGFYNVLK